MTLTKEEQQLVAYLRKKAAALAKDTDSYQNPWARYAVFLGIAENIEEGLHREATPTETSPSPTAPHVQRMLLEAADLDLRLLKARRIVDQGALPPEDLLLLEKQVEAMRLYLKTLKARIHRAQNPS